MTRLRTIDMEKLEREIDLRRARFEAIAGGRPRMPLNEGIQYRQILAEHNALVAVFNSLQ